MPDAATHSRAIDNGIAYVAKQQLSDGNFESFSSPTRKNFQAQQRYRTTFVPSLMLAALSTVANADSQAICRRLATFLKDEASPNWSFNYWAKQAPEYHLQPYPDDLDDTFCALSSLFVHDPKLISERVTAQAVKLLLATESAVGGPYRTWLVPTTADTVWLDVDLAVNANVAYFLSLVSQPLPNLTGLIDQAISDNKLVSPYYPSAYPIIYYIARGYNGRRKTALVKIIRQLMIRATNPLETALCLSSLARLEANKPPSSAISQLLAAQKSDGSWPTAAFCLDPAIDGQTYYHGAAALTTAFAVEALALCRQRHQLRTTTPKQSSVWRVNWKPVLALAEHQCHDLAPELRTTTLDSLHKLATSRNGAEIISLPRGLNRSLRQPLAGTADNFFESLSLANLYGWLAYTIYDDFLDEEGQPRLLPSANVAMRGSLRCFNQAIPRKRAFQDLVRQVFDTIDGANAWELAHCRFPVKGSKITIQVLPDYGDLSQLAERSLGHTLTPLAILSAKGISVNEAAFQQAREALRHYLVVRQLNDDVHDWQADLKKGHINYVVARILSDAAIQPETYHVSKLLHKMQQQFWHATLPAISQEMQAHIDRSRQALEKSQLLAADNTINRLLGGFEVSLTETLAKQRQTIRFLEQYKQSATKI